MSATSVPARSYRVSVHRIACAITVMLGLAACGEASTSTDPGRLSPSRPLFSATDITLVPILWNQGTFVGGHAHAMDEYQHAADFIVPSGAQWVVEQFMLAADHPYTYVNDQRVWLPATFSIRANDGGHPGAIIQSYSLTPADTEGVGCTTYCQTLNNLYQLPAPLTLGPGTYWLAVSSVDQFTWYGGAPSQGGAPQFSADFGVTWSDEGGSGFDFDFAIYGLDGTPASNAQNLQATLQGFGLPSGTFTALNAKLRALIDAIQRGDTAAACSALNDFINQVNALAGKKLTTAQATTLINAATSLRGQLGC